MERNCSQQTYWNKHMSDAFMKQFTDWVGNYNAESKVFFYNFIDKDFKTILDVGCGDATIYDGLKHNKINIEYTGVDSCKYFIEMGRKRGVNIFESDIRTINKPDSSYDIIFGRHVVEHQPDFETLFNEMIRLGKKQCVHIFFIKPKISDTIINYDQRSDLYHNTYSHLKITEFLTNHPKVNNFFFKDINENENALIMNLHF